MPTVVAVHSFLLVLRINKSFALVCWRSSLTCMSHDTDWPQSITIHQADPSWSQWKQFLYQIEPAFSSRSQQLHTDLFLVKCWLFSSLRKLLATNRDQTLEMILSHKNKTVNSKTRMRSAWSTIALCASVGRFVEDCANTWLQWSQAVFVCNIFGSSSLASNYMGMGQQHQNQSAWLA